MDHISIVIVHFNSDVDTKECLATLSKLKVKNFELDILVVDNGSKEPLVLTKAQQAQNLELIRSESNLGFTGGNNLGIQHAIEKYNSEYLLLLNNDTLVDPDCLQTLYDFARNHPKAGLINPKIYFAKGNEYHKNSYKADQLGNIIWYAGGSIDWVNMAASHKGVDEVDRGHYDTTRISDFATGCCVLVRREVFETVGLLDESLFLYWEDVELSLRARKAGFESVMVPEAYMWHKNAGSSDGSGSPTQIYYQTRNRLQLGFEYGDIKTKLTIFRLAAQLAKSSHQERVAVQDFFLAKKGKQPII